MPHEVMRYVLIGMLLWFMVATVLLLLLALDNGNGGRTPRITTIVALLPAVLTLHLCGGMERILSRILFADGATKATPAHRTSTTSKE